MKILILALIFVPFVTHILAVGAQPRVYEGTWRTTNRKLDGTMTCEVTDLGKNNWRGRFYGVWQGVPFDYPVTFRGAPSQLRGTATIDGANYVWSGTMEPGRFQGTFGGDRYEGSFDLSAKRPALARKPAPPVNRRR